MQTSALNEAQSAVVSSDSPLIVCVAGPGSGKTMTIIERMSRLLIEGALKEQIVCITFTNAAAEEIKSRISLLSFGGAGELGFVGTLHSFLLKLIQQNAIKLGYATTKLAVLDEAAADDLLERCAIEVGCKKSSMTKLRNEVRHQLETMNSEGSTAEMLAVKRFFQVCRQNAVISYDMILSLGLHLLKTATLDLPYKHLFVDEAQDLSRLQADICELLPIPNAVYVGDSDQSVFAFQGADVGCFVELANHASAKVFALESNYRSDRAICEAAQRLIEHNITRVAKVTRPVSEEHPGIIVVREFKSLLSEQTTQLSTLSEELAIGHSVAILVRTNKLCEEWTRALQGSGIPVACRVRNPRPTDWAIVKATIAVLNDPANDWACYTLIRLKDGEARASEIQTAAQAAGVSINEHLFHLAPETPLSGYTKILARLNACDESIILVTQAIAHVGPEATGTDLMAHLVASEFHEDESGTGVTVSTMHSAKGREFDCVILPAFEQEIIPGVAKSRSLEEERRLAYVAFTRARHRLFISHCQERKPPFGGWQPLLANPSQFISEAGL